MGEREKNVNNNNRNTICSSVPNCAYFGAIMHIDIGLIKYSYRPKRIYMRTCGGVRNAILLSS